MKVHSLRVRLLLIFMVVVMAALVAFAVFASQVARDGLQRYVSNEQVSDQKMVTSIQNTYKQMQSIQRVQTLTERLARQSNVRIIVMDHNQYIIADSAHVLVGQTLTISLILILDNSRMSAKGPPVLESQPLSGSVHIISTDGRQVALGQPSLPINAGPTFLDPINRSLALAVLIAGLVALALTLILSSAVLKPVKALTLAARRMEQGDLSQRVNIKKTDEIGGLAHAFNIMAESLGQAGQLQRNLVSDVAHELRTPLTNIRGYLEALQDQVIKPDTMVIASLHEETMLLSRLVTDLQDLTLAEAGQLHLQCIPVALEDIITNAVNSLLLQAREKNLVMRVNVPADLPLVEADPQRVRQILLNLLSNAIRHTPSKGEVHVIVRAVQQVVEVRVQDTGEGIAAEHLPSLFKRFYRADPSRTRATGGTGLGLAIVEQLVHAHGGRILVESQVGQGTCFLFTLPVVLV